MLNNKGIWILVFLLGSFSVFADETDSLDPGKKTPRQAFERAEALFETGHLFTVEEFEALNALEKALKNSDEDDLHLRLSSLILASKLRANAAQRAAGGTEAADQICQTVIGNDDQNKDKEHWKLVRNIGLFFFVTGATTALVSGASFEIANSKAHNSYYSSDGDFYRRQSDFYLGATLVSLGFSAFGLIPMVTAEGHLSQ